MHYFVYILIIAFFSPLLFRIFEHLVCTTKEPVVPVKKEKYTFAPTNSYSYKKPSNVSKPKVLPPPPPQPVLKTEQSIINDCIDALRSTGYKKKDAIELVSRIVEKKVYTSVNDLFIDCCKRK